MNRGKYGGLSSSDELGDSKGLDAFLKADLNDEKNLIAEHKIEAMGPYNDYYGDMNEYDEYGYNFDEDDDEVDEYNFEVDLSKPKAQSKPDPSFSSYQAKKQQLQAKKEEKLRKEEEERKKEEAARARYEAQIKAQEEAYLKEIEERARAEKNRISRNRVEEEESHYFDPSNDENVTKSHFEESDYLSRLKESKIAEEEKWDNVRYSDSAEKQEFYDQETTSKIMQKMAAEAKKESESKLKAPEMKDNPKVQMPKNENPPSTNIVPKENNFVSPQPIYPQPLYPQNFIPQNQYFIPMPQNQNFPEFLHYNNSLAARQEIFNKVQLESGDVHDTFALRQQVDSLKAFISDQDAQLASCIRNLAISKNETEQVSRMLEVAELRIKSKDSEILTLKSEIRKISSEKASVEEKFIEIEMLKRENDTMRNELKQVYLMQSAPDKLGVKIKAEYESKVRALQEEILDLRGKLKDESRINGGKIDFHVEKELKSQELLLQGFQQENEKLVAENLSLRQKRNLGEPTKLSTKDVSETEELNQHRKAVGDLQAENASLKWEIASLKRNLNDIISSSIPQKELEARENQISMMEDQIEEIKAALFDKEEIIIAKEKALKAQETDFAMKIQEMGNPIMAITHQTKHIEPQANRYEENFHVLKQKLSEAHSLNETLVSKVETLTAKLAHEKNEKVAFEKVLAGLKTSGEPGVRLAVLDKKLQFVEQNMKMKNIHFRELLKCLALEDTLSLKEENKVLKAKLKMASEEGRKCKEELSQLLFDVQKLR